MTEQDLREQYVKTAEKYLGAARGSEMFEALRKIYNTFRPLPRGYAVKADDQWCAMFVSAIAILCGLTDIIAVECSCSRMVNMYQALGRWIEDESIVPEIGDIILYDWDDTGKGDCRGDPDHVGIVVAADAKHVKLIEGNISGSKVAYRTIAVNARYIRGYAKPDYARLADALDIGDPSAWARESCLKAVRQGVVAGYGEGDYGWQDNITREQLVVIMDRLGLLD